VGEVYRDQKSFDVTVWGSDSIRTDVQALVELLIDTPNGATMPLQDVAEIAIAPAPNEIKHEGASRRLDVTCDATGRDLGSVAREIQQQVATLSFPAGYHPEFLGEYAGLDRAQRNPGIVDKTPPPWVALRFTQATCCANPLYAG
jgi:Cu/Ag efflux pump CusA